MELVNLEDVHICFLFSSFDFLEWQLIQLTAINLKMFCILSLISLFAAK